MNFGSIAVPIILVILIIGGLTSCFWGYRRFILGVKSSGFFIGGLLGFLVVFPFGISSNDTVRTLIILGVGFLVGGLLGFFFALSMNKVLTFIAGGLIGFFLSILVFSPTAINVIFSNQLSLIHLQNTLGKLLPLHIVMAVIIGVLAIFFQRPIIIVSTSIWGSAWIMLPVMVGYYWMKHAGQTFKIDFILAAIHEYSVFLLAGWIVFAVMGSLFQFRYAVRKEQHNKQSRPKKIL